MSHTNHRDIDKILAEQSAELHEAVNRNEPGSQERLANWLCESRRHVQHYLTMVALDRELEGIDRERRWTIEPSQPDRHRVIPLPQSAPAAATRPLQPRRKWRPAAALAATLVALVGGYGLAVHEWGWKEFVTAVGEQRAIELDDGSVVHLNTQSHLAVRYSDHGRDIRLLTGEALFKVHRDAARPFRVHAGDTAIQAVGTEFNVYRRTAGTTVSVLEGRVRIERDSGVAKSPNSTSLGAGQQARIDAAGRITELPQADLGNVAAWRQRRLIFKSTPLPDVIAEFNRYNRTPHFELRGSNAAERVFSGIFDADDSESLIELLEKEPGLLVERKGNSVSIVVQ